MKCSQRVRGYVTSAFAVAAGEEVQHWIWLLRTFSDRCCVTHLNARLLYMVSPAIVQFVRGMLHMYITDLLFYMSPLPFVLGTAC